MKHFTLDAHMTAAIGGAFYPTGYSMVMFPNADDASRVGHQLIDNGVSGDDIYLIPPETVLSEIASTVSDSDNLLPSAGTDGATVRVTANGKTWTRQLVGGDGFAVSSERLLIFGMGEVKEVDSVTVEWPAGTDEVFQDKIPTNSELIVVEGSGRVVISPATR